MTDTRAAFEAWAQPEGISTESDENGYMWDETVVAWDAWQASRQQALTEAANVCETQIDPTRSAATSGYAYWHAKAIKELLK